jgi:hypothetical protein
MRFAFPPYGPYTREITGISADKVVWKGVEINPGKAGRFLIGPDDLQGSYKKVAVK